MLFTETALQGLTLVAPERMEDERGWFARTFCASEFRAHGLEPLVEQCNTSFNANRATLRGMHYQAEPHGECKLVRCTRGAIYDVAIDLRSDSPTYLSWVGAVLTAVNAMALYIPDRFAHGFLSLEDDSEVLYQMSTPYAPAAARGVRWDDAAFGITWPQPPQYLSERDRTYPDFTP